MMFKFEVIIITQEPTIWQVGFSNEKWEKNNAGTVRPKTIEETSRCNATVEVKYAWNP